MRINVGILVTDKARTIAIAEQLLLPRVLSKYALDIMHFPNFNVPVWYRGAYVVTIHDMVHHKISGHKKKQATLFLGLQVCNAESSRQSPSGH
jgi:hypothetical protein